MQVEALPSPLVDQTTSRIVAELGKNECEEKLWRRGLLVAIATEVSLCALQTQNFSYAHTVLN